MPDQKSLSILHMSPMMEMKMTTKLNPVMIVTLLHRCPTSLKQDQTDPSADAMLERMVITITMVLAR